MSKTRHILSLSGGKDSAALAIYMRDRVPEMEYIFHDTDKELDETYEYLDRLEAILGKPILKKVLRSPKLGKKAKEAVNGLMKHADWIEKLPQEIDEVFKKHDITKRDLVDSIRDLGKMIDQPETEPETV